jgi:hypothetical protein
MDIQQMASAVRQAERLQKTPRSVKGVYDSAQYGYDLHVPFKDYRLTNVTTFTYSTGISERQFFLESFTPSANTPVTYASLLHSTDLVFMSDDTVPILHAGDNTAFNRNYIMFADMSAQTHQIEVCLAVALNCSAYTNGSLNLNSVSITPQSFMAANQPLNNFGAQIFEPSTAFTALTATGLQIFVIRGFVDLSAKLKQAAPLVLNVTINTTISGTNTSQVGILPRFADITNNINKDWNISEFIVHIHALPEHIDEILGNTTIDIEGMSTAPPVL